MPTRSSVSRTSAAALIAVTAAAAALPIFGCSQLFAQGGSSKTAAAANLTAPPKVGDTAPDFTLDSLAGKKVTLSKETKKSRVVLVMLRGYPGYQCPICTAQVGELMGKADAFKDAKAQVILVYPGPSSELKKHADEFVQGKNMPAHFTLLLDPDYSFTSKYALRWDARNETSYPATFVLAKDRKILFAKVSNTHGGRAKSDEILPVLTQK